MAGTPSPGRPSWWSRARTRGARSGAPPTTPLGKQELPARLHIDTLATLAGLVGRSSEWAVAVLVDDTPATAAETPSTLTAQDAADAEDSDPDDDELSEHELDVLGPRPRPYLVTVILADPADRPRVNGLRHRAAPADEHSGSPLARCVVLVVVNKESALKAIHDVAASRGSGSSVSGR